MAELYSESQFLTRSYLNTPNQKNLKKIIVSMGENKKQYDEQFRMEAIRQLLTSGKSAVELSEQLGVDANLLRQWKSRYIHEQVSNSKSGNNEKLSIEEQNIHLKIKVEHLQNELHIIKKAMAIMMKES